MSEHEPQSENIKALEKSLNDHMEICCLRRKVKRIKAEVKRFKTEVERLRKAGDAMALSLANGDRMEYGDHDEPIEEYMNRKEIADWNAAKEGKPSV
jgi:hypothetical protein